MSPDAPVARFAVIVPAYRCAAALRLALEGLLCSDLPRRDWELVVVDDGSDDDTAIVASAHADRVVTIADGPRGPAHARNAGAAATRAPVIIFVDADVVVARDTLRRLSVHLADGNATDAVFGAYDTAPSDRGFISQYRNLLHHRVHSQHRGAAMTFWAGCGAVRHAAFDAVGQFDAVRYTRPQVEDIELGYRLYDAGYLITLDPGITGRHLKRWTFLGMVRTDLVDRAIPWMQLLLERHAVTADGPLNTGAVEKLLTIIAGLAGVTTLLALLTRSGVWLSATAVCLITISMASLPLLTWFARIRGVGFAVAALPLRWIFYGVCALASAFVLLSPRPRRAALSATRQTVRVPSPPIGESA